MYSIVTMQCNAAPSCAKPLQVHNKFYTYVINGNSQGVIMIVCIVCWQL